MKHLFLTLLALTLSFYSFADSILIEGFEYGNHDLQVPVGWSSADQSWLSGYQDKDHNRTPRTGNWYAFTNAEESWMYMPLYFSSQLRYRFSLWTVSDGSYTLEFWLGSSPDPDDMGLLLHSVGIDGGDYQEVSFDVNSLPSDYVYLGIRAVASTGAAHLTIDDIDIKMINRYDMDINPYSFDTVMEPGSRITIEYEVKNTGFEDLDVYMTPYTEYFTDISFTVDGANGRTFPTVPNQVVRCTCTATLLPTVTPGTRGWMDIMFTVSCDCITRMTTLWFDAIEPTDVNEQQATVKVFPNPSHGDVSLEGNGMVTVTNTLGQIVMTRQLEGKETFTLPKGLYLVRIENVDGIQTTKLIVE
ncbi:MAG: T9SS type A sorting domain-containing protein [Bacteroidales bacterium]|nr:T9SS type A sorting domain-containing protein [Bacteroidales bacterium]